MQTEVFGSLREKIAAEGKARKARYAEFEALYDKARAAGLAAGNANRPAPMTVVQPSNPLNDKSPPVKTWYEPEGLCGFAWIKVRPGNSPFANWLKKTDKVSGSAYSGGVDIWVSDFNQSVSRKEAYASAFAKVLQEAGIKAYSDSRLD